MAKAKEAPEEPLVMAAAAEIPEPEPKKGFDLGDVVIYHAPTGDIPGFIQAFHKGSTTGGVHLWVMDKMSMRYLDAEYGTDVDQWSER